jgi:hypothetical protein
MLSFVKFSPEHIAEVMSVLTLEGYTIHIFHVSYSKSFKTYFFLRSALALRGYKWCKSIKVQNGSSVIILRSMFGKLRGNILY